MSFLTGYVEFSGLGGFQEKFVSELFENKIRCRKLRYEGGYIHARISPVHYLYASRLARKHGFRIRVTRKKGAYFRLFRFRKRYGLAIGMMIFCLLLIWSSNYIWDVDVEGNESVPTDRILTVMHDINFAAQYSDRICAMKDGKIAAFGEVSEIMNSKLLTDIFETNIEIVNCTYGPIAVY